MTVYHILRQEAKWEIKVHSDLTLGGSSSWDNPEDMEAVIQEGTLAWGTRSLGLSGTTRLKRPARLAVLSPGQIPSCHVQGFRTQAYFTLECDAGSLYCSLSMCRSIHPLQGPGHRYSQQITDLKTGSRWGGRNWAVSVTGLVGWPSSASRSFILALSE
jgi:hypothetical protein